MADISVCELEGRRLQFRSRMSMETSVTSIGRFLKVLGDMVSIKSSLANVKGNTFHIKLFGQLLEKNWATF